MLGSILLALAFSSQVSLGGDVLLHDGETRQVIGAAAELVGADVAELTVLSAEEAFGGRPPVLDGATWWTPCDGGATSKADVVAIAGKIAASQAATGPALKALVGELAQVEACMSEIVDPIALGQAHASLAFGFVRVGDVPAARDAFRWALRLDQSLKWDPALGKPDELGFTEATTSLAEDGLMSVKLVPAQAAVLVNGIRLLAGRVALLPPGPALIQVPLKAGGYASVRVDVPVTGASPTLYQPDALASELLAWLDDEARAETFWQLVTIISPPGSPVHATREGRVWTGMSGSNGIMLGTVERKSTVAPVAPAPRPVAPAPVAQLGPGVGPVGVGGIAGIVAGGALAGIGLATAASARADADVAIATNDSDLYGAAERRNDTARLMTYSGYAVAGLGAIVGVSGVVMRVGDQGTLRLAPQGAGLGLRLIK